MAVQAPRKVLIAFDDSDYSHYCFEWFVKYIVKDRDHLFLFYCEDPDDRPKPPPLDPRLSFKPPIVPPSPGKIIETKMKGLILDNVIKGQAIIALSKNPGEAIVKAVIDHKIDFVIIGSQGKGYNSRTTVGRICAYVMEEAPAPTIVCRLPYDYHAEQK